MGDNPDAGYVTERIVIVRSLGDDGLYHVGASFLNDSGEMLDPIIGWGMLHAAGINLADRVVNDGQ